MKNVMTGVYIKGDENFGFNFGTDLTAYEKAVFVNSVAGTLVDDDDYNFIIRDLIFDFYIVKMFSDIDTTFVKDAEDDPNTNPITVMEEFLEDSNIVDIIKVNIKGDLIDELNKAVDLNVEYKTGIHKNALNDALTGLIDTLEKKLNEIDITSMVDMAKAFTGVSDDFTPENIVKAYMSTDVAKKNVKRIK